MNFPKELLYSESHEWVQKLEGGNARVGLTDFAQHELGDLVFINLPQPGDSMDIGDSFCDVESVKAVSEVLSPVSGTVSAVNDSLAASPEAINADPYGAWLVEVTGATAFAELMDAKVYEAFCEKA